MSNKKRWVSYRMKETIDIIEKKSMIQKRIGLVIGIPILVMACALWVQPKDSLPTTIYKSETYLMPVGFLSSSDHVVSYVHFLLNIVNKRLISDSIQKELISKMGGETAILGAGAIKRMSHIRGVDGYLILTVEGRDSFNVQRLQEAWILALEKASNDFKTRIQYEISQGRDVDISKYRLEMMRNKEMKSKLFVIQKTDSVRSLEFSGGEFLVFGAGLVGVLIALSLVMLLERLQRIEPGRAALSGS